MFAAAAAMLAAPANAGQGGNGQGAENSREINLQILAINYFHGNIASRWQCRQRC